MLYRILDTNQMERGPFPSERILARIADGRSHAGTKIKPEGSANWTLLGDVPEFAGALKQSTGQSPNFVNSGPVESSNDTPPPPISKKCTYCGKENDAEAVSCRECGMREFAQPKPHKSSLGASSTISEIQKHPSPPKFHFTGGFKLLLKEDGSKATGTKSSSSWAGMKIGILSIGVDEIIFEQRQSLAGGILIALVCLFPAGFLLFSVQALLNLFWHDANRSPGTFLLLTLASSIVVPIITAWRARKSGIRFPIVAITSADVCDREVEFRYSSRPGTNASSEARKMSRISENGSTNGAVSQMWDQQLTFRPATASDLPSLVTGLSSKGIKLTEIGKEEQVAFAQRLLVATPRFWVLPVLLILNGAIFALMSFDAKTVGSAPLPTLVAWGGDFGPLTANDHQWWRLLTCCFIHIGIFHLLCNMYALVQAGPLAERLFGNWFFLAIYLSCGIVSSMTSVWWSPSVVSAGASGAIFGVYGALLGYLARQREGLPRNFVNSLTKGASVFIAWNLFYGLQQAITHSMEQAVNSAMNGGGQPGHGGILLDQAAHLGGLVSGLLFGYLAARPLELQKRRCLAIGNALVLALCFGSIIGLLFVPALSSGGTNNAVLCELGAMYLRGEGVGKDVEKSIKWFKKAAEQGDLKSQKILGTIYLRGEGVETNVEEAIAWFNKAGEQGDVEIQKFLANMYYKGEVVDKNMEEAVKWLSKVADRGDSQVAAMLASIYFKGDGVAPDVNEAAKWVQKAAELGDVKSESFLGSMYFRGENLPQDKGQAASWYQKAAMHGEPSAQTMLGLMLAQGEGVAQDKVEAWKWLMLGGSTQPNVLLARQALESEFTADQTLEANNRLQRFRRGKEDATTTGRKARTQRAASSSKLEPER